MGRQNYDAVKNDFKSARDWHVYHVYNDPEFIDDILKLNKRILAPKDLQDKYAINNYDVFYFETKQIIYLENNVIKKGKVSIDAETRKAIIAFDLDITKTELLELLDEFTTLRDYLIGKPQTKRKAPEYHQLVYAIFKARKSHSFREIYVMAVNRTLPYFDGVIPNYWDEDKLEAYYDKFKPSNF